MKKDVTGKEAYAPRPVMWVHDSIISTPGSSLIYTNAYNNIAIPGMAPEMAKMGERIKASIDETLKRENEAVKRRGQPVGIGEVGEYPAMGALFDDIYDRVDEEGSFKKKFMEMQKTQEMIAPKRPQSLKKTFQALVKQVEGSESNSTQAEMKWKEYRSKLIKVLEKAEEQGWVNKDSMGSKKRVGLAVTPEQFAELSKIAAYHLNVGGPSDTFGKFVRNFSGRVQNAYALLKKFSKVGGIRQMSSSGARPGKDFSNVSKAVEPSEQENKPLSKIFAKGNWNPEEEAPWLKD
jgi:hypothetical protein